ncbi:hypothetical protein ACP275_04G126200 [Erythranthe tilingii]
MILCKVLCLFCWARREHPGCRSGASSSFSFHCKSFLDLGCHFCVMQRSKIGLVSRKLYRRSIVSSSNDQLIQKGIPYTALDNRECKLVLMVAYPTLLSPKHIIKHIQHHLRPPISLEEHQRLS